MKKMGIGSGFQQRSLYKIIVSILFGLIGFIGVFYSTRLDFNGFYINFPWSILLPLLVSLAWGPFYGLLSVTLGLTMLYPFFLGDYNGWASLVPAASLFLWITIQGYGAQKRRMENKFYYNAYFLQFLYVLIRMVIYIVFFPVLLQFNPPFWNPEAFTQIDTDIILIFAVKGIIVESILLALCDAILLIPRIRKIFKLPCKKSARYNTRIILGLVSFGLLFTWIMLTVQNFIIDQKGLVEWMINPTDRTVITFFLSTILFVIMGGITVRFAEKVLEGQESLRIRKAQYNDIFEGINDLYLEMEPDGTISRVSPSVKEILKYEPKELLGRNIADLYDKQHTTGTLVNTIVDHKEIKNHEMTARDKKGQKRHLIFHAKLSDYEDGKTKIISVARDVTRYMAAVEKIQMLNEELEQRVIDRTAELEKVVAELESFTYTISHDLKSPLRAIDLYSQFIMEDHGEALAPEVRDMLGNIRTTSRDMIGLVERLLVYSTTSKSDIRVELFSMEEMFRRVFDEFEIETAKKLQLNMDSPFPVVQADRVLLRQVVTNLMGNAIKFSGNQEPIKIFVGCKERKDEYLFYLKDHGVGFDMKYSEKLFGIFQRLHSSREFEGSGIGLATVKNIIEKHGGRVWIKGELDKGTTVYFTLPRKHEG